MKDNPGNSPLPPHLFEWIEKTYLFTLNFGPIHFKDIRLRTRQLWTPFMALVSHPHLPPLTPRDIDGIDAIALPGFPISAEPQLLTFPPGLIRYGTFSDTRYLIAIEGTYDAYLRSRSSNTRQKLNKHVREFRLAAGDGGRFVEFEGQNGLREFYSIASPLSETTWQGKIGRGLDDMELRDEILRMASVGQARGYILFCRDRAAAFALCHVRESALVISQIGYDAVFADWAPGITMHCLLLEKLFNEGKLLHLDLMEGSLWPYKSSLATIRQRSIRFFYFRRNLRSLSLVLSHFLLKQAEKYATRARDRLRKLWRSA